MIIETVDACAYENYVIYFFLIHKNIFCFIFILIGLFFLFNKFELFRKFICLLQLFIGFTFAYLILYFTLSYKKNFVSFTTVFLFCLLIGLSNSLMFYYMKPLGNIFTFSITFFLICFYVSNKLIEDITIW